METKRKDNDPTKFLKNKSVPDVIQPTPSIDEVRAIWNVLLDKDLWKRSTLRERKIIAIDRALFAILSTMGLRNSSIRELRVRDFDLENKILHFINKRNKPGQIKWGDEIHDYFVAVVQNRDGGERVFKFGDKSINTKLKTLCAAAGVNYYSAHSFRRFVLTEITQTIGLEAARKVAHHSDLNTTMRYDKNRNEAVEGLKLWT